MKSNYPLMVRAFDPSADGQSSIFQYNFANNTFTDKQTGSKWDFEGKLIEGPLKGKQLLRYLLMKAIGSNGLLCTG
jgi:hypothetical protein